MFVSALTLLLASQATAFSPSWVSVRHPASLRSKVPNVLHSEAEPVSEAPVVSDLVVEELPAPTAEVQKIPLADLVDGSEMDGVVKGVSDFGAFVDFGAEMDGLVHKSQMSTEFVKDASDIVSVGDTVHVRILRVDLSRNQVSLSMKPEGASDGGRQRGGARKEAADLSKYAAMQPADRIPGTVRTITSYGAFIDLEAGVSGLLHISQLANTRVESVESIISVGEQISVRVTGVEDGRISLSMTEYDPEAPKPRRNNRGDGEGGGRRRQEFIDDIWTDNTESEWSDISEKQSAALVFDNKPSMIEI